MKSWQAELLIFLAAAIWGSSYIFTFWGLEAAPPATLLLMRFLVGLLCTLLLFGKHMFGIDRTMLRQGLILGSLFGMGYLLQFYSIQFTMIAKASFIVALVLPATPIVSYFVLRKPISVWNIMGVAIALYGIYTLVDPFGEAADPNLKFPHFLGIPVGDLIALASIPFWAFYMNYIDIFTSDKEGTANTARMLALQFCGAIPLLLLTAVIFESGLLPALHPELGKGIDFANTKLWISVLYNGVLASFVLTFLQTTAQKYTTPVKAMLVFQFEPIIATLGAIFILGDPYTANIGIGAAIIICGVLLSECGGMLFFRKKG